MSQNWHCQWPQNQRAYAVIGQSLSLSKPESLRVCLDPIIVRTRGVVEHEDEDLSVSVLEHEDEYLGVEAYGEQSAVSREGVAAGIAF